MRVALIAGIALAGAAPASATVVVTTFTGIVGDAQGNVGASSPFGAIAAGTQTYSLVYTIDDGVGGASVATGTYGKSVSGTGSVTAALTINGITRTIGGQTVSSAEHKNAEPDSGRLFDRVLRMSQDFSNVGGLYSDAYAQTSVGSYLSDYLANGDYATPFTYTPVGTDSYLSTVHFNIFDFNTNTQIVNVYLNLGVGSITSMVVGEVPEPASWALMLGGFGMVGGAMRRRAGLRPRLA